MAPRDRRSPSGAPRTRPEPALARARPRRSLIVVVLPAPFGPRRPSSSPRPTVRSRPCSATVWPYVFATPWSSIAGDDTLAVTGGRQGAHIKTFAEGWRKNDV